MQEKVQETEPNADPVFSDNDKGCPRDKIQYCVSPSTSKPVKEAAEKRENRLLLTVHHHHYNYISIAMTTPAAYTDCFPSTSASTRAYKLFLGKSSQVIIDTENVLYVLQIH